MEHILTTTEEALSTIANWMDLVPMTFLSTTIREVPLMEMAVEDMSEEQVLEAYKETKKIKTDEEDRFLEIASRLGVL